MNIRRALLAIAGAAILLGAMASAGSAGRLETSETRLRGVFRSIEFNTPGATTRCALTLDGSFHERTTIKDLGSLVGYLTRAILGSCTSGTGTVLTETLPWHIRYSDFEGTLPEIRSVIAHIVSASWRVRESGGIACLARSSVTKPAVITFHRDPVTHVISEAGISGRISTGAECLGVEGTFSSDSGSITVSNSSTSISISLI
jgi:hypothetical protein